MIDNLIVGIKIAFTFGNIFAAIIGTLGGIIVGALPGLTATMGVALLVPVTFLMDPVTGLIMLSGIYCGGIYGGSITGILLNTPGTPAAIMTMLEGNIMTKNGEAKKALSTAILASFVGGLVSAFALLFLSPPLANFALRFGPPEYFCLALFGMTVISSLTTGQMIKGLIVGFFGVFISTIGLDPCEGIERCTFDTPELLEGFSIVPVLIGLFSIPEAIDLASSRKSSESFLGELTGKTFMALAEYFRMASVFIKSSIIGTIIGIVPAAGPVIAPFVSYREAKRSSKISDQFGKGIPDGIVAAEAANNGVTGGSLIPLLTLGIPGSAVAAVYLGALTIHGLQPGPMLFMTNPDVIYGLFVGFFIVQITMLVMGLTGSTIFAQVIKLPKYIISSFIFFFSIIGSLAMNGNIFDVWVMYAFGILGYFMKLYGFPAPPIVLGLILGPMLEENLFSSLQMSHGSFTIFLTRPLSIVVLSITIFSLLYPYIGPIKKFVLGNNNGKN
jgi:putative tricarboxylic transport membrane protein